MSLCFYFFLSFSAFKRDKDLGNFLVRSSFQTNDQPETFKCARSRCKTCPFIHNLGKMSGPKRSIKITDHFTCTSADVIYCITCAYCNKLYIGVIRRRLGDQFREHLCDVVAVVRHFNLPYHSKRHMAVCGLPYIQAVRKATKLPTLSKTAFHSTNLFLFSRHHIPTNSVAPFSAHKPAYNQQFLHSL